MLNFTDPKVAEQYESEFVNDPEVHIPAGFTGEGWKGKLSTIPLWAAKKAVAMKSNVLVKKNDSSAVEIDQPPEVEN